MTPFGRSSHPWIEALDRLCDRQSDRHVHDQQIQRLRRRDLVDVAVVAAMVDDGVPGVGAARHLKHQHVVQLLGVAVVMVADVDLDADVAEDPVGGVVDDRRAREPARHDRLAALQHGVDERFRIMVFVLVRTQKEVQFGREAFDAPSAEVDTETGCRRFEDVAHVVDQPDGHPFFNAGVADLVDRLQRGVAQIAERRMSLLGAIALRRVRAPGARVEGIIFDGKPVTGALEYGHAFTPGRPVRAVRRILLEPGPCQAQRLGRRRTIFFGH